MARKQATHADIKPALPEGYRWGKDILCEEMVNNHIAMTPEGRASVFIGYVSRYMHSSAFKYSVSVADRENDSRSKFRFVSLDSGTLEFSPFLRDDQAFCILNDRWVALPRGSDNFFGVIRETDREVDVDLTRKVFGVTHEELANFLPVFNEVAEGFKEERYWSMQRNRITFSRSRSNHCDLCDALIPENFPFIAFGETNFYRGHVSLHGLFRLLAFMCHSHPVNGKREPVGYMKQLTDAGASMETIDRMIAAFFACQRPIMRWEEAFRHES